MLQVPNYKPYYFNYKLNIHISCLRARTHYAQITHTLRVRVLVVVIYCVLVAISSNVLGTPSFSPVTVGWIRQRLELAYFSILIHRGSFSFW